MQNVDELKNDLAIPIVEENEDGFIKVPEGFTSEELINGVNKALKENGSLEIPFYEEKSSNTISLLGSLDALFNTNDEEFNKVDNEVPIENNAVSIKNEMLGGVKKENNRIGFTGFKNIKIETALQNLEADSNEEIKKIEYVGLNYSNKIVGDTIYLETGITLFEMSDEVIIQTQSGIEKLCNCKIKFVSQVNILAENVKPSGENIGISNINTKYGIQTLFANKILNFQIDYDEIQTGKWLNRETKGKCYFNPKYRQAFVEYCRIKMLKEDYLILDEFLSSGWKFYNGDVFYAHANGVIGKTSNPSKGPEDLKLLYDESRLGTKGIFDAAFNMRKVIKRPEIGTALFFFVIVSLMTTFFREANFQVKFILSLVGKTNSKKTSIAMLFTKIFNRTQVETPDMNFRSTKGAIEEYMEKYTDACLLIDDFAPQDSPTSTRDQNEKQELIVRSYGDRTPRQRMTGYLPKGAKAYFVVNGCGIITGEIETGVMSSKSRIVNLEFEKNGTDNELLSYYQKDLLIWTTFIVDYLQYLSEHALGIIEYIRNVAPEVRRQNTNLFATPRYCESYTVFICAINVFFQYALERGYLMEGNCQELFANCVKDIQTVIAKNDFNLQRSHPAVMFAQGFYASVIDKSFIIVDRESALCDENCINNSNVVLKDSTYFYIRADVALERVIKYWKKFDITFPFKSTRSIIPFLAEEGLILTMMEKNGKLRNSHKLNKCKITDDRFLYISQSKLSELISQNC